MITLGIETSCDETSVALVQGGRKILSNIVYSSLLEHRPYGGVIPEIASRSHLETVLPCLQEALKKANRTMGDIDLVAVTQGPGLLGSLLVGITAAKTLSLALGKPLVGVDHVMAHLYSGFLMEQKLAFPLLGLVVSGGHTMLVSMESARRYQVLGTTLDDAAGEAFDKVAKILGLGYPGGPEIDRLAKGQDAKRFFFTRPYLSHESLDFSFSGIKTAVFYTVQRNFSQTNAGLPGAGNKKMTLKDKKAIAAGFQEAVCEVLVKKSLKAAKIHAAKTLVVGGGVSANSRLKQLFSTASKKEGVRVIFPSLALSQDNAAMIAALGTALYREGRRDSLDMEAYPEFIKS